MLAVPLTDYYEEVRRYLTCPEEVKDDLIYDVNRKVMDLNADRPDLDYDGILEFLGDPEDLANSLMEQMSDEVIQKFEKKEEAYSYRCCYLCSGGNCCVVNVCYLHYQCSV